jgi:hypothetical protein
MLELGPIVDASEIVYVSASREAALSGCVLDERRATTRYNNLSTR